MINFNKMQRMLYITFAIIFIAGCGGQERTSETIDPELNNMLTKLGFQLPKGQMETVDFELSVVGGGTISLLSFKGKVVFLNFWATWCSPCRAEMPSMEQLYQHFQDRGLAMLAVNLQEEESQVREFMNTLDLSFTALLDTTGKVGTIYGARSIPTTYIIDRSGSILARAVGSREWYSGEMIQLFEELIK